MLHNLTDRATATVGAIAVCLLLAVTPAAAQAGTPAKVSVRVEGQTHTLLPLTQVTTTTTPPPTDQPATGTSAAGAIELATNGNWDRKCFTQTIMGETHNFSHNDYWAFWLGRGGGYTYSQSGICNTELQQGDEVLMLADVYTSTPTVYPLALSNVPASVQEGSPFTVTVTEYRTDGTNTTPAPSSGASVSGGSASTTSDMNGHATLTLNQTGDVVIHATKASRAPANGITVCVHNGNDGNCGTRAPSAGGPTTTATTAPTPSAPTPTLAVAGTGVTGTLAEGQLGGIRYGQRFARRHAPRVLRGTVTPDAAGIADVRLRLSRRTIYRCQGYDARRERFRSTRCGAQHAPWFSVGTDTTFSYLLPHRLRPGRYVLDVEVIDGARHRDDRPELGRNRIVFAVLY